MAGPVLLSYDNSAKNLVTLKGLDDVERMLNELTSDLRRRVVRQALRDAAKPIVNAARVYAKPRDFSSKKRVAGTMRRAINVFNSKKNKGQGGVLGVYVSVKASRAVLKKRPISGDPFYWRFVEGGHKIVPRLPKSAYGLTKRQKRALQINITARRRAATVGGRRVQPYEFLAPAFKTAAPDALRIFQEAIIRRIEKANSRK